MSKVAGLVLASGMSRRYGGANKLLAHVGGEPVVRRATLAYVEAGLDPVVVVIGYQAQQVRRALSGLAVTVVVNPDYAAGQSRALAHGVRALPLSTEAAVIGVGDQPWLLAPTVLRLVETWRVTKSNIVAPLYGGQRGNPVVFARALFPELLSVDGDTGGRPVIAAHAEGVTWLPIADVSQRGDVDSPDDLL